MAHPFVDHRQTHVEHSRVAHIAKGYASGGAVHSDEAEDRKMVKGMVKRDARKAEGERPKHRADRPMRASGGRVKKGKATTVNVIIGGQHDQSPAAMPVPVPAGPPPMATMPPRPPMAPPPAVGPGMPPPGLAPRSAGGRTYRSGGRVNSGTKVFEESRKLGTQVSHDPGKSDLKDLHRPRVVTYATGGAVDAPKGKKGMGPDFDAGALTGEGRLEKIAAYGPKTGKRK